MPIYKHLQIHNSTNFIYVVNIDMFVLGNDLFCLSVFN